VTTDACRRNLELTKRQVTTADGTVKSFICWKATRDIGPGEELLVVYNDEDSAKRRWKQTAGGGQGGGGPVKWVKL